MGFILDSLLDVAADAIDGAVTGKGDSFGAELGKAFREGWDGAADDAEDQAWSDWVDAFENEVNADSVYFEVKHKLGHSECTLSAVVLDEDGNVVDSNAWEVEYDDEIKQLHKKSYQLHQNDDGQTLLEWVMTFNDNPDADHTYSEVHHKMGEENATITVQIVSKNGDVIASQDFEGAYEDLKSFHKDVSQFPIVPEENTEQKSIEALKPEQSVEERLAKLKQLFESGVLEEDEYKEKRKELISTL